MQKNNTIEDRKLIAKAQQNAQHFGLLYDKYFEKLYYFIFSKVKDEALAGDITQNTMLKAMANIRKYKWTGRPFLAWLYRIGANEVNMYFRKNKKEIVVEIQDWQLKNVGEAFINTNSMNQDQQELLINILQHLNPKDQELIELRFFSELSMQEIADYFNIGLSAAKMRLYRTLEKIQDNWMSEYEKI